MINTGVERQVIVHWWFINIYINNIQYIQFFLVNEIMFYFLFTRMSAVFSGWKQWVFCSTKWSLYYALNVVKLFIQYIFVESLLCPYLCVVIHSIQGIHHKCCPFTELFTGWNICLPKHQCSCLTLSLVDDSVCLMVLQWHRVKTESTLMCVRIQLEWTPSGSSTSHINTSWTRLTWPKS